MAFMRKKYLRFALVVCALIYAGAVGSAAYRMISRAAEHERAAMEEFNDLVEKATAAASLGFMEEPFRDAVRQSFERSGSLAAVIVSGPSGPEYAVEREEGYLVNADDAPVFPSRLDVAPNPLVAPLRIETARNASLSATRVRFYPTEAMSVLRDSLLIAVIPLLASLVILLAAASKPAEEVRARREDETPTGERPEEEGFEEEFDIPEIAADVAPAADADAPEAPTGLYGPGGLLGWEDYLQDRLSAELKRSAAFEQDLVLLVAEIDAADGGQEAFRKFAEKLVEFFSFKDLAFKLGENGAAVILPNVDLPTGLRFAEEFMSKVREAQHDAAIGLSARAGRLVDGGRLLREAQGAVVRARSGGKYQIMAFKPDPERYRNFVAANR
jgi:GGDEF domain-containing protein